MKQLYLLSAVLIPAAVLAQTLPATVVTATSPLSGIGLEPQKLPYHAQRVQLEAAEDMGLSVVEVFSRRLQGTHLVDVQSNALMPDLVYRGYTASPLLGTPQGLSVYLDGMRMNQPFGDVVSWGQVPRAALKEVTLVPGSNPVFGLNTLGGSLVLTTKDGQASPGTSADVAFGSYGRKMLSFEHGGASADGRDWYVAANSYQDEGWRQSSPTQADQVFAKLGWRSQGDRISLSFGGSADNLTGNGLQQAQLLSSNYASVFTKPDITKTNAYFLNLQGFKQLSDKLLLDASAYYRASTMSTYNGDLNEEAIGQALYYTGQPAAQAWLAANGYGTPAVESADAFSSSTGSLPKLRCLVEAGINGEPNEKCSGLITTTLSRSAGFGFGTQLTQLSRLLGLDNQLAVGVAFDSARMSFKQESQFGYVNSDRSITPVNAWADGTQDSPEAFDQRVDLTSHTNTWSVFASDTLTVKDHWHITAGARFNETRLENKDGLYPYNNLTTQGEKRGTLDGSHIFSRLNPSVGVAFAPSSAFSGYFGYSESSRTPTSIELGCADPNFGCRLPNSMAGDPPLNQVVTSTWELGARGRAGAGNWRVGLFQAVNHDDLLFVANTASTGYFRNFGKTRRQGLEAGLGVKSAALEYGFSYTLLRATYESPESILAPDNSSADTSGKIAITPGDRIPMLPEHLLKAHVSYKLAGGVRLGLDWIGVGESFARGNENNKHEPNGVSSLGSGVVPGYSVFNARASYKAAGGLSLFVGINNLLDARFYTAGQLGPNVFDAQGRFLNNDAQSSVFYSPGAPRALWAGARKVF